MQDKVLDLEKRSSSLPDETNVAQLQEELKLVKLRELETLRSFREMRDTVTDLNQRWQHHMSRGGGGGHWKESPKKNAMNELQDKLMGVRLREAQAQGELRELKLKALQLESQNQIHSKLVSRQEQESAALKERLQSLEGQNKTLQAQLNEMKRKQAESDCKVPPMPPNPHAKHMRHGPGGHGRPQYITQLRDQISELKAEIRQLRGQTSRFQSPGHGSFQSLCLPSRTSGEADYLSSDEDLLPSPLPSATLYPSLTTPLRPSPCLDSEGSTDSDTEEGDGAGEVPPPPASLFPSMVCAEEN
ncbi:hypothetical protein JZ751_013301 [Albula glossodonta]|uniref:Uncharacterized protein n=1 Tax=Albula glossodonta TaxID=121402 RepID=A0A8T2NUT9_9TELE|nr:hypothetical protein JZ751_013301 [Albula glossodonta]